MRDGNHLANLAISINSTITAFLTVGGRNGLTPEPPQPPEPLPQLWGRSDTKHPRRSPGSTQLLRRSPNIQSQAWSGRRAEIPPCSPPRGGVGPALHSRGFLVAQGHGGGGVSLGYCHLLGLGGLLPAVRAVAGVVHLRGTALVEAVGDAALGLTLHESALKKPQRGN